MLKYHHFAYERIVAGVSVQRVEIAARSITAARKVARDAAANLTRRQTRTSVVRLLGMPRGEYNRWTPLAVFEKSEHSGRVVSL